MLSSTYGISVHICLLLTGDLIPEPVEGLSDGP